MILNKKIRFFTRALAATAFACFAFWVLAQQAKIPPGKIDSKELLNRLQLLYDADQYQELIRFSDSISILFQENGDRISYYKVIRLRTMAQKEHRQARQAVIQLIPQIQGQTIDDSITAKLYGLIGFGCLNAGDYEQGAWYYEQNLTRLQRHGCTAGVGTAYMNLGYALKQQGDYRAARQYYLTALPLLQQEGDTWNISEACNNLGDISRYLFEFDTARHYYRQMAVADPNRKADLAYSLGWTDADQRLYRDALGHFRDYCRQTDCAADVARIMGRCAERLGDTLEADRQYLLALQHSPTARDSGVARWYHGQALLERRKPEAALQEFQQALHNFFPAVRPDYPADNPGDGLKADFWPVILLRDKARALHTLYARTGNRQRLTEARATISAAAAALDTLRLTVSGESGQDAVDYAYSAYETGIRIALDQEHTEPGQGRLAEAYALAEHAKSGILKANLMEKDLRRDARLPDSLLWQEKLARSTMAFWEEAGRPDSLLAATRRLEALRREMEQQAPLLAKARRQTQSVPVAALQQALTNDALLLQYFWGDSAIIAFAVGKNRLDVRVIPHDAAVDQAIDSLRAALTDWRRPPEAYSAAAAPLYSLFCAPLLESTGQIKRLFIIPDGPLWAVPFEALPAPGGRFLVQDYAISYHWSGALWWQARNKVRSGNTAYGGFAPQYPAASQPMATLGAGLGDLPEARAAVTAATEAWGGQAWQGPAVDKALFQREAGRFGILHLAMHGLLDPRDRTRTGLAFPAPGDSIRLLNTLEISQMDLSTQLTILSACNTGSGKVYRGEGVMSLSRAFALAGCPTITANLWEVPSRETNDITATFLRFLKDGKSKDEALRAAKLNFLQRAEAERRHPFFWAGQVLVGSEEAVSRNFRWAWWAIPALIIMLAWFVWQGRK